MLRYINWCNRWLPGFSRSLVVKHSTYLIEIVQAQHRCFFFLQLVLTKDVYKRKRLGFFIQVIASLWALNNLVSYSSMIRASNSNPGVDSFLEFGKLFSWSFTCLQANVITSFHARIRPAPFHDPFIYHFMLCLFCRNFQ